MSKLAEALKSGRFVVTAELNPVKGTDTAVLLDKADKLRDAVDAFNLTDSHSSRMTMSPMAAAHLLLDRGVEPILQITCRDRNRIALQSDLLGAHALGVSNVLCMSGDDPTAGDHPDAKPVFDLEAIALLRAIALLQTGRDLGGSRLKGTPTFFAGAVVNPGAPDLDKEMRRMEDKIEAGASLFQTQAVYDPEAFEGFMRRARKFDVSIIAGLILLKSGDMARKLNASLPGFSVPDAIIAELDDATDRRQKSAEITARIVRAIRPMCDGVHLMALGWESLIPQILESAGIERA